MDFRERLLINDIRHMAENLRTVSEELMELQDFVREQFGSQFKAFLKRRKDDKTSYTPFVILPSSSSTVKIPVEMSKTTDRRCTRNLGKRNYEVQDSRSPIITIDKMEDGEGNQFSLQSKSSVIQHDEDEEMFILPGYEIEDDENDNSRTPAIGENEGHFEINHDDDGSDCGSDDHKPSIKKPRRSNSGKWSISPEGAGDGEYPNAEYGSSDERDNSDSDSDFDPHGISAAKKENRRRGPCKNKPHLKSNSSKMQKQISSKSSFPKCRVCHTEVEAAQLLHHINSHDEEQTNAKFVCRSCCKVYDGKSKFDLHKGKCVLQAKTSTCQYCGIMLLNKSIRDTHERTHAGGQVKPYSCEICLTPFSRNFNLKRHLRTTHASS